MTFEGMSSRARDAGTANVAPRGGSTADRQGNAMNLNIITPEDATKLAQKVKDSPKDAQSIATDGQAAKTGK